MTRGKHLYENVVLRIAKSFADCRPESYGNDDDIDEDSLIEENLWDKMVIATADNLAAENPSFERGRFLTACGYINLCR